MTDEQRLERNSRLQWHRVSTLRVSTNAQRKYREAHAQKIANKFDPDKIGIPVVSIRDGHAWVIDGQHRVAALKLIGYGDQQIQCDTYTGLTERDEAEMFDGRNDQKAVLPYDRFMVRITAHRQRECDIARTVAANNLELGHGDGKIGCVTALGKVYDLAGPERLGKALRILRDSWGAPAMSAQLIEGMGFVVHRYNGDLDEETAIQRLSTLQGGAVAVMQKAQLIRRQVGRPLAQCVAAATVDAINRGKGGKKLPIWWA